MSIASSCSSRCMHYKRSCRAHRGRWREPTGSGQKPVWLLTLLFSRLARSWMPWSLNCSTGSARLRRSVHGIIVACACDAYLFGYGRHILCVAMTGVQPWGVQPEGGTTWGTTGLAHLHAASTYNCLLADSGLHANLHTCMYLLACFAGTS